MQKLKFSINGTKYEATVAEKEHMWPKWNSTARNMS